MNIPLSIFLKIAFRTPDLFLSVARETIRSHTARLLDYRFGRGRAFPPRYIDLKMTNLCNLRCSMCGQWGDQGNFRNAPKEVLQQHLELPVLKRLVKEVAGFRPSFYLWGGEPFLYRDLIPFISCIKANQMVCAMNTNGTFLTETAEDLVRLGVDNLLISVDGPREVHDRVRGMPGTFDRVMAGVERILSLRRERRAAKPYVTFVTTINRDNASEFHHVYDLAAKLGVDFVGLQFGTSTSEATGAAYEKRMQRCLGCAAKSWRGFLSYKADFDVAAVQEGLRRIRGTKHPFGTYFIPDLYPEDLPEYYGSKRLVKGHRTCIVPWIRADLLPNGDVYPCIDFPDYIVGNIHETPLMTLWNGPRYVRFRRELQKGLFAICSRCSSLYEF